MSEGESPRPERYGMHTVYRLFYSLGHREQELGCSWWWGECLFLTRSPGDTDPRRFLRLYFEELGTGE